MLPPRPFLDVLVLRTLILWTFVRGVTWAGSGALRIPYPASLVGGPLMPAAVFAVVLLVSRIEMSRKAERLFLANLGCSFSVVAVLVAAECALLEGALRIGVG